MANKNNIPLHIAIIPDGNRRWAQLRGLAPWEGHEAGAKNLEKILEVAHNWGIKYLSFWGSSLDNLNKRPLAEKKALLDIYKRYFKKLIDSKRVHREKIKINVIGRWEEEFPNSLKKIVYECLEKTKDYQGSFINFLLAYSGDDEMVLAVQRIIKSNKNSAGITEKTIKANLMTKDLPPVDLLVRTGGEPHLSAGFMMWDIANAQLYFSPVKWPDFGKEEFDKAIEEYKRRGRRFGK